MINLSTPSPHHPFPPSPLHPLILSNLQPDASHQFQRVAASDDAGLHFVIEDHPPVFQMILEMDVGAAPVQRLDDPRQRQVMRGDEADGAAFDQPTDDGFGAGR